MKINVAIQNRDSNKFLVFGQTTDQTFTTTPNYWQNNFKLVKNFFDTLPRYGRHYGVEEMQNFIKEHRFDVISPDEELSDQDKVIALGHLMGLHSKLHHKFFPFDTTITRYNVVTIKTVENIVETCFDDLPESYYGLIIGHVSYLADALRNEMRLGQDDILIMDRMILFKNQEAHDLFVLTGLDNISYSVFKRSDILALKDSIKNCIDETYNMIAKSLYE